jgi:hypothetical protein
MILESLKPTSVQALCEQLTRQLAELENEISQYDFALLNPLEPAHRQQLEQLRARRVQAAAAVRSRMLTLNSARYNDDQQAVWSRIVRVA